MFHSEEKTKERKKNIETTYKVIDSLCKKNHSTKYTDIVLATGFSVSMVYSYVDHLACGGLIKIDKSAKEHLILMNEETESREDCRAFKVNVGDVIEVKNIQRDFDCIYNEVTHRYKILKFYPHMVLTEDISTKYLRCFAFGDMIVLGLARQPLQLEAIRRKWK